jgi:hypothetical protein
MRIIISGEHHWTCDDLAIRIIDRLIARYGREGLAIAHGADLGMDAAFARAATLAEVEQEPHPIDRKIFGLRAEAIRNGKMVAKGADLCLVFHRFILIAKGNRSD